MTNGRRVRRRSKVCCRYLFRRYIRPSPSSIPLPRRKIFLSKSTAASPVKPPVAVTAYSSTSSNSVSLQPPVLLWLYMFWFFGFWQVYFLWTSALLVDNYLSLQKITCISGTHSSRKTSHFYSASLINAHLLKIVLNHPCHDFNHGFSLICPFLFQASRSVLCMHICFKLF